MAQSIHSSFVGLSEAGFKTYADTLLTNSRTGAKRKEAISYLQSINSSDKVSLDADKTVLQEKRRLHRKRQEKIELLLAEQDFDFTKTPDIFSLATISDANMLTALTVNNSTVYVKDKVFVGDVAISGDNIKLDGEGQAGSARSETLANTAQITGTLILSGDSIVVKNIDFTSTAEKAITVIGAKNITLDGCKFKAGSGIADSKWFYGEGILSGDLTIKNCIVEGFTSSYLMDASTTSATPTVQLQQVRIKQSLFKNNLGSMAVRGMQDNPNKLGSFTNNKVITTALHASFWDAIEFNNTKKVIITGNEFEFPTGTELEAGKKGVSQVWSRSNKPWYITYEDNSVKNIKFGIKIPTTNTFYAPNTDHDSYKIDVGSSHTNVTYAASFLYKKNDGSQASALKYHPGVGNEYTPVNITAVPSLGVTVVNPNGLTIVQ